MVIRKTWGGERELENRKNMVRKNNEENQERRRDTRREGNTDNADPSGSRRGDAPSGSLPETSLLTTPVSVLRNLNSVETKTKTKRNNLQYKLTTRCGNTSKMPILLDPG